MTDPKHLPPRDCMVELDAVDETGTTWVHATHERQGREHVWFCRLTGEPIDPERVIDFREMDRLTNDESQEDAYQRGLGEGVWEGSMGEDL